MSAGLVFYDAPCRFCRVLLASVLAADREHCLLPLPIQSPEGDAALGDLPQAERLASFHLVCADGRYSGGEGLQRLLALLPSRHAIGLLDGATSVPYPWIYERFVRARRHVGPRLPQSWIARADHALAAHADRARQHPPVRDLLDWRP